MDPAKLTYGCRSAWLGGDRGNTVTLFNEVDETAELDFTRIELLQWPRNELAAEVQSLRKQRDALLAALKTLEKRDTLTNAMTGVHQCDFCGSWCDTMEAIGHADMCPYVAIAKAHGVAE